MVTHRIATATRLLPAVLAVLTVLAQILYPLIGTDGHSHPRDVLTVVTVLLFAAASLTHAAVTSGFRSAVILLGVSAGFGFAAEAVGTETGFPFGSYTYSSSLGLRLLSVPIVIPLAWTMMAWPALLVGRRLVRPRTMPTALVGGVALASWDVFLDPQMTNAGHWIWHTDLPALQGIPLTNYVGWLAVAVVIMLVLDRLVPIAAHRQDTVPAALFLWTFASSVLANLIFFQRPVVALTGAVAMGAVAIPCALSLRTTTTS